MAIRIVIEVGDDGKLNFNGPLNNKILCYGILELAKVAVTEFKAEVPRIVPAGMIPFPKNGA